MSSSRFICTAKIVASGRRFVFGLSIVIFFGVLTLLVDSENSIDVEKKNLPSVLPIVTVEKILVSKQRAAVEAFAEVKPRWVTDLKSEVSGTVMHIYDAALAGNRVSKGDSLFSIDDTRYLAELAEAEQAYSESELARERAEYSTQIAKQQFKNSNSEPPNDLALQLPQLRIAGSSLKATKARVNHAKRLLAQTVIKAPYSGYITDRYVSPGQVVMVGDTVARLIDDSRFEIAVSLNKDEWGLLDHPVRGQLVSLYSESGELAGHATIREGGGYLNEATRHLTLYLDMPASNEAVLAGDFVKVHINGRLLPANLSVPAAAVTQDGYIWWVDSDSTLSKSEANVLFRSGDTVFLEAPNDSTEYSIVSVPMASYLPGQRIKIAVKEH
jgi:multidrug efflux system membrane fusion protein